MINNGSDLEDVEEPSASQAISALAGFRIEHQLWGCLLHLAGRMKLSNRGKSIPIATALVFRMLGLE